jgi:predicted Zn-ribbon and HTH transcriptional regulator
MINIQDVLNRFFDDYRKEYKISYDQYKVLNSIMSCRTSKLGGHANACDSCGHTSIAYNSCRNRHCPICQSIKREKWRIDRNADLLNIHYFHVVFTVPDFLNPIFFNNQRLLYSLLMKSAATTLMKLTSKKKYLGAQIGLTGILHTWGQTLSFHPHVHFIVPGGGLCPKTFRFKSTRPNYLLPVKVISRVFRAIFLKELKKLYYDNLLINWSTTEPNSESDFKTLIDKAYSTNFVVYAKENFNSPTHVIKYLCQYTHRVAISNHRILNVTDQNVTFKYKDYKDNGKTKTMTLKGTEFIRRYLMHVLPKRFVKIRHYGIFAGRNRPTKLALCQRLMKMIPSKKSSEYSTLEFLNKFMNLDFSKCPKCFSNDYKPIASFEAEKTDSS